jgi:hypothetical protein
MAEIVTFQSIENPLEKLVTDAGKNAADILCPKETCKCVVFRKNTASLVERDGAMVIECLQDRETRLLTSFA